MPVDYYSSYKRYLTVPWKHQLQKLGAGHIVNFRYKRDRELRRLCFILNNETDKLHCLKLNQIPRKAFERFFRHVMTMDTALIIKRRAELKTPVKTSVNFPLTFYNKFLERNRHIIKYSSYRTYLKNKITGVKLIGFDMKHMYSKKELEDKQLKRILIDKRDNLKEIKKTDQQVFRDLLDVDELHDLEDREFRELVNFRFGSKKAFNAAISEIIEEEGL